MRVSICRTVRSLVFWIVSEGLEKLSESLQEKNLRAVSCLGYISECV